MPKLTAAAFATLFNQYCNEVRNGTYDKIEYKTWRAIDGVLKDLKRKAYLPDDWGKMPLYFNVSQDDIGGGELETYLDISTPDRSIDLADLLIPDDLARYLYRAKVNNYNIITEKKENATMMATNATAKNDNNLMNNMMPTLDFGPVTGDTVRVSPYGMAIKNKDGAWVSYNPADGSVISVAGFTFDLGQMLFKVPVALNQIQKGDMVIHNRVPMYVTDVAAGGKQVSVVDIREGEIKTVMPPTNMFGFNFVTKVVSFINFPTNAPDPNNPFGNIIPYIFMSAMFNGGEDATGGLDGLFKGDMGKMFVYSMMFGGMNGGQNPFANLFSGIMPQPAAQVAAQEMTTALAVPPANTQMGYTNPPQNLG